VILDYSSENATITSMFYSAPGGHYSQQNLNTSDRSWQMFLKCRTHGGSLPASAEQTSQRMRTVAPQKDVDVLM